MLGLGEQRWLVDVTRHPGSCSLQVRSSDHERQEMEDALLVDSMTRRDWAHLSYPCGTLSTVYVRGRGMGFMDCICTTCLVVNLFISKDY